MPTIINNKEGKFTEAQQREIVQRVNEAYDRGGADVLKLMSDTIKQIEEDSSDPKIKVYVHFCAHVIEGMRIGLQKAVEFEKHDLLIKPDSKIIAV